MCVVCRDELDGGARTCLGCGTLYHQDCLAGLRGRCATIGCLEPRPAQVALSTRPGRLVLSSAQVAAAASRARPSPAVGPVVAEPTALGCLAVLVGSTVFTLILARGGTKWFEIAVYVACTAGGLAWYAARALCQSWSLQPLARPAPAAPEARGAFALPSPPAEEGPRGPSVRVRPRAG